MKRYFSWLFIVIFATIIAVVPSKQVKATTITGAQVDILLTDFTRELIDLVQESLTGDRGAIAAAEAERKICGQKCKEMKANTTSFFGDTGLLIADCTNQECGSAIAKARNKLRGKVCYAESSGEANAAAALTWNGKIVWATFPFVDLPSPNEVLSATINIDYFIDDVDVVVDLSDVVEGTIENGSFSIEHFWDGEKSFDGSVEVMPSGLPQFKGDLIAFASDFINTQTIITASTLDLSDTFSFEIDYSEFFSSKKIEADFKGAMEAGSASNLECCIPEPTTMLLLGTGLVGLTGFRKKFKKS